MKKLLLLILLSGPLTAADNEIFLDQSSGASESNIDLEQLGSGNIIGAAGSTAGDVSAFVFSGTAATLDINQIGDSNKWLGKIIGDSYTGFYEFDGNSNSFTTSVDPTNTYGADSSNVNVDVTGSSNTFTLNQATTALASTLDLDWIIDGSSNTITSTINVDSATNYVNIDGNDNALTHTASGFAGNYFYLDHDGSNRTFNITQSSTLDNDWLKILSSGTSTSTVCVVQNDQGTSTGC